MMKKPEKLVAGYLITLFVVTYLVMNLAKAEAAEPQSNSVVAVEALDGGQLVAGEVVELDQQDIDRILAPIALYPDSLLSHVLVASTYPLEVVQAARWRKLNSDLNEDEVLDAVEDKDWDPSVKALVPYDDLLQRLSDDLTWLQQLGDAFLTNEEQVLATVQVLRHKAYEQGSLQDSEYIEVVEEDDNIVIESTRREVIYVPYYDTRIVYGPWWWSVSPIVWVQPAHYYWHAGFYWSPRVYVRPSYFHGGFHWHRRHLVVNHHYYNHADRRYQQPRRVNVNEYQRWQHDPTHRKGARYSQSVNRTKFVRNKAGDTHIVRNTEMVRGSAVRKITADSTRQKLKKNGNAQFTNRTRVKQNVKGNSVNNKARHTVKQDTKYRSERKLDGHKLSDQVTTQRGQVRMDSQRSAEKAYRTNRPSAREPITSKPDSQPKQSNRKVHRSRNVSTSQRGTRQVTRSRSSKEH